MKVSSLIAFAAPMALALGAVIPKQISERQSGSAQPTAGTYAAIAHDLERFKVDLSLLQSATESYYGYLNLQAAQVIVNDINALSATLKQATSDAQAYAATTKSAAQEESDSQSVVAATNSVAPYVQSATSTLIQSRATLEPGPIDALFGNTLIITSLYNFLQETQTLENALIAAISADQVNNLEVAFQPIIQNIQAAYNYYSGF